MFIFMINKMIDKRIESILNDVVIYKYNEQKLQNILKHIEL